MSDPTRSLPPPDLGEVIGAYLEAVDEGHPPAPEELLGQYPEFAADLRRFLTAQGAFEELAGPFCPATPFRADAETVDGTPELPRGADGHPAPVVGSGEYDLCEEVGRGGMGAVYRARDAALGRDIAVKVLQDRYRADPAAARRFLAEARVTAELAHPGVPPVHAVGALADGRPFLAMKLIDGETLDELLFRRPDPATDRGRLLAVFERVCQAVAFAHSRGIVHRDLKPANIMVGRFGETLVMDWGLAKSGVRGQGAANDEGAEPLATSQRRAPPDATREGSVLGTPAYMPPEQAAGDLDRLDERADVFGLGAVLCAVLTGQAPYTGATAEEIHGKARRAELGEALTRLDGCGVGAELVELCKQCLAPDRDARPRDAGAVAAAVAGFRSAAEERARRAELDRVRADAERAGLELRAGAERQRRRAERLLAGALALLVSAGGAFAWWADRRAGAERLAEAERARDEGERQARIVAALGALLDRCEGALRADAAGAAADALREADRRATESGGERHAERVARLRATLDLLRALDRADELDCTWRGNRFLTEEAARERAEVLARHGLDPDRAPVEEVVQRVKTSLISDRLLAALDLSLEGCSPRLLAALRTVDPDPYRNAVRAAVRARHPLALQILAARDDALAQPPRFAVVLARLAPVALDRREKLLAAAHLRAPDNLPVLMGMAQVVRAPVPGVHNRADVEIAWLRAVLAARPGNVAAWNNLGSVLRDDKKDVDGALACFREAIRLDPAHAIAYNNLGIALHDKKDTVGATAAWNESIRLDPRFAEPHKHLAGVLSERGDLDGALAHCRDAVRLNPGDPGGYVTLANVLYDKRDLDGAIDALRRAIARAPGLAIAHSTLGSALYEKRDLDGAEASLREAVRLDPNDKESHNNLGLVLKARGDFPEAIACFRRALQIAPNVAAIHLNLGSVLGPSGDPAGARACFEKAIELDPALATRLNKPLALAHFELGNHLRRAGDLDGMIAAYQEAVRLDPDFPPVYYLLGNALRARGDVDGAIAQLRHAVRLIPRHAEAHTNLGNALLSRGDLTEAADCFREAIRLSPNLGMAHYNLGNVAWRAGDLDQALASYREAVKWQPDHAESHCNLGHTLRECGEFAEALKCLRRGHELGSGKPGWRYSSARWVSECAELVRQDGRLAAVLTGTVKIESATELLTFARICGYRKQYADAVRFYEQGFAKDPRRVSQHHSGLRSAAAGSAVLAAGAADPAGADRPALRGKALDWLRADLAAWTKDATDAPASRAAAHRAMTDWLADRSFARVRHPFLLAALPADEAKAWLAVWAAVRDLRGRTAPPPTAPFPRVKATKPH